MWIACWAKPFSRRACLWAFCFILAVWAGGGAAKTETVSNDEILAYFDLIAFGAEHEVRTDPRVIKWTKPVNVVLLGERYPDFLETDVNEILGKISTLTGLQLKLVYSPALKQANDLEADWNQDISLVLFYFEKDKLPDIIEQQFKGAFKASRVRQISQDSYCHGAMRFKDSQIELAYVAFDKDIGFRTDYGGRKVDPRVFVRACVVEEISQLMGLPNDSAEAVKSIFNDHGRHIELTEADQWMLRILYDPSLKPGMARDEANVAAAKLLERLRPER